MITECSDGNRWADEFRAALRRKLGVAQQSGQTYATVNSGALHREVGGYPGPSHRMPICCHVMKAAMSDGDKIIESPPKGRGASLTIAYRLPR